MTVGELREQLKRYDENEELDIRCLVDNNFYRGYVTDVYKLQVLQMQKAQPVTIELKVDCRMSIRQRFDMLGKMVEEAIERNSYFNMIHD